MTIHSIGDQARAFVLQSQTVKLRSTLNTLTDELSTGKVSDVVARVKGNTGMLNHYETRLSLLDQLTETTTEAAAQAATIQSVLGAVHSSARDFSHSLLATDSSETTEMLGMRASEAKSMLEDVVSRLNTDFAGFFLFSGLAGDTPPVRAADEILSELQGLTAGLTTAAAVESAVGAWFDSPPGAGGYLDFGYNGTTGQPRTVKIDENRHIAFSTNAATPEVREVLKGLAIAALSDSAAIMAPPSERQELLDRAGSRLYENEPRLLEEAGRVGLTEQMIQRSLVQHSAEQSALLIGRSKLVSADPFETAAALTEVQTHLETMYSLTARLSQLNLVDYLR